jgi:hypothetical protein
MTTTPFGAAMISKILNAAILLLVGGVVGYVVASDARLTRYFHGQQTATVEAQPNLDAETKYRLQERCADRAKIFHQEEYAEVEQEVNRMIREAPRGESSSTPYIHTIYERAPRKIPLAKSLRI